MHKQLKDISPAERSTVWTVGHADSPDDQEDAAFPTYAEALNYAQAWSMKPKAFNIFIAVWAPQTQGHKLHHLFYNRNRFNLDPGS